MLLKRLAYFLRNMDQDTHTYPEMYDAELFVVDPERAAPDKCFDPIYYNEDIGFKITGTHKLAQDKPTVTINIPIEKLSMEEDTLQSHTSAIAAADHCLRKFAPYIDGLNAELYKTQGVSTILVIGGSGEYLYVADKVYMMDDYLIHDVTEESKRICRNHGITQDQPPEAEWTQQRKLYSDHFSSYPEGSGSEKLEVSDMGIITIGDEKIDVRGLHDIITSAQLDALGFMLRYLEISNKNHEVDLPGEIDKLYRKIMDTGMDSEGLDTVWSSYFTNCERFLDLPRKQELFAVINRMRKVMIVKCVHKNS